MKLLGDHSFIKCVLNCARCMAIVSLTLIASGCGEEGPKTYPVKGKITHKGGKPVNSGNILFESLSDPKVQASGELQPDGSFEMASNLGKPGTIAGEHRVLILPQLPELGQKASVANKYAKFETSGLKATVKEGENELTFEID